MIQKIIRVGNSAAITIPKKYLKQSNIKVGDQLKVEIDERFKIITLKPANSTYKTSVTPEFKQWLDDFTKKHKKLLQELARTPGPV